MLTPVISQQFALDIKACKGQGKDFTPLKAIIDGLEHQRELPVYCCDGPVPGGRGRGYCKVSFDWWLIYKCDAAAAEVILERTGSWEELFGQ
jgi:mRNA-degrading endonuclease YafQ of YafQ-DinJ toxin-antitoxin module